MVASGTRVPSASGPPGIARRGHGQSVADACLTDYRSAPISDQPARDARRPGDDDLRPEELRPDQVRAAMAAGVTRRQLLDATAVAALFNIITRYANALDFTIPTDAEFEKSAGMMLKRGYA